MSQVHTFVNHVRKSGRVTIPEAIRIAEDIRDNDMMFFAVSDKPFKAELLPIE